MSALYQQIEMFLPFETVLHFETIQSTNFRLNASEPEQHQITAVYTCVVDKQMQNVLTKMYNAKYLCSYTPVTMNILNLQVILKIKSIYVNHGEYPKRFHNYFDKIMSDSTKQNEIWKQYNEKFFQ
ncbi:Hypothetical_protein [Hexamita inflata]|uniref:Hypothetical_protein n=1 Tax=Hexamita inflata TaxID=28002 RepID=A0AA86T905_9EUKA|nr:Hypothetical protein HINF_LOCUS269 [Hexamita inflata]